MKVSDWIVKHPYEVITVTSNASTEEALDAMLAQPCARDIFVIDDDGKIVGHLSHIRLAKNILMEQRPVHTRRQLMERVVGGNVSELMDPEIYLARCDEPLDEVLSRQLSKQLEDMPVVDKKEKLIGAINLSEVLREWRKKEMKTV